MFKRLTPSLILVIALSLLASLPLLQNPGLPNGSDVLYHVFRVGEMGRSWQHGMPFPRWAEGLYFGYGSPLWHFYASLTYYITTIFSRYLLLSSVDAIRLFIVCCYMGMGISMYAFMRRQLNELAGVLGAVAYVYSPYILFTEPYARGTYPELLAFALFPFVMWRIGAVLRLPNGVNIAFASLAVYFFAVSHNLMAITLTFLLIGWLVWNGVANYVTHRSVWTKEMRPYFLALGCVVIGLGLSSYFWVPVILESHTVNLQNLTGVSLLDYRHFYVTLPQMLQPMPLNDMGAINGLRNVTVLGVAQWVGALIGVMGVAYFSVRALRQHHYDEPFLRQGAYFALMAVVLMVVVAPISAPLWDGLRPLQFLQFPWRLFGPIAFCMAFLVGANALWLEKLPSWGGSALSGAVLCLTLVFAVPAFTVPEWTNLTVDTSISAYHASEVSGLQRGTTFTDEYRPRTVYTMPNAVPSLLADYADGYPVNKAHVPDGVEVTTLDNSPIWLEWRVVAPEAFQMEVYTFFWEGWRAAIDGQVVEITPSPEHGLITFPVPKGKHNILVYLGTTPARMVGDVLSALSLAVLLAVVAIRINNREAFPAPEWTSESPSRPIIIGLGIGAALGIGAILWNPVGVFWLDSPPGTSPASQVVHYDLGDEVRMIGYDINGTSFRAGDTVELTVYWYPSQEATVNYSSFVHIGKLGTPPLAQQDKLHPADRVMTEWWKPVGYLFDQYSIRLPQDMPNGEYDVLVGLYTCELMPKDDCGNGFRPTVTDADGNTVGDIVPLVKIKVE